MPQSHLLRPVSRGGGGAFGFRTVSLKVLKKEFLLKPRLKHSFTCKALCSTVTRGGSYFMIFLAFIYPCFLMGGANTLPLNDSDFEPHTDAGLFPLDLVRQTAAYCFVFGW